MEGYANPRNAQGKTPLDRAYEFGHSDCAQTLFSYSAVQRERTSAEEVAERLL